MSISPPSPPSTGRVPRLLAVALALLTVLLGSGCAAAAVPTPPEPPPAATAPLDPADVDAWLDGMLPAALARTGIPGAAVTVVRDGRLVAARGYGTAGDQGAVDPERTLFRVGSVSKVATAVAVLQQVEQGRIDLDADVSRYLDFPLPRRYDAPITVRHLLTHTAGFEERVRGLIRTETDGPPVPLHDTLAVDPPEQVFAPGTTPAYSNYGYGLAGLVVERVSGEPFEQYVQRHVLDPAGMTSSTFAQPLPAALAGRMSAGAASVDAPPTPFEVVAPAPPGALTASATDMARLASSLLGTGTPLLRPGTTALMQRPALDGSTLRTGPDGPRMALGLFDEGFGGRRVLGHGGDTNVFHSHLELYPDQGVGVFVTLNGSGRGAADSLQVREALVRGFGERYVPGTATAPRVDPGTAARAAAAQGRYESARAPFSTFLATMNLTGQTTVTARPDGTLVLTPGATSPDPVVYREVRPWAWQEVGGRQVLTMRPEGDRVDAIGFESAFTLLRVAPWRDAGVALPVVIGSAAVLVLGLLAWPVGALVRRHLGVRTAVSPGRADRVAQVLTRAAAVCAVVALAGWVAVIGAVSGLTDVGAGTLRTLGAVQGAALVGIVAAAVAVVTALRGRVGGVRVAGRVATLLALCGVAWIALAFGLLSFDISY